MIVYDCDAQIEKLLASRAVDWKLKEKLRLGETCKTCEYFDGSVYCLYELSANDFDDDYGPGFIPFNMRCEDWKKK
jgi:hypothetical protein